MFKKVIKWILVLLCMLTIFFFSSDNANKSTKKSNGLIVQITQVFLGHKLSNKEKEIKIDQYDKYLRKSAHFTLYLILGLLLISALYEYKLDDTKTILIALLIAFLYACSDEFHQLFVPGRSGEILDVLIDTLGSLTGIMCYYYTSLLWRKKHE